jgi:hypothetical protein
MTVSSGETPETECFRSVRVHYSAASDDRGQPPQLVSFSGVTYLSGGYAIDLNEWSPIPDFSTDTLFIVAQRLELSTTRRQGIAQEAEFDDQ